MRTLSLITLSLCTCTFDTSVPAKTDDAAIAVVDASMLDAPIVPDALPPELRHLLLSEVKLQYGDQEFIEIYNPTSATILLDDYYLADTAEYAKLPGRSGDGPAPSIGGNDRDFVARFPVGARIEGGQVQVVAIEPGSNQWQGFTPNYYLRGDPLGQRMRDALHPPSAPFPNEISLTNDGEGIVLFYWDGMTDLVTDVDLVDVGAPSPANRIAVKNELRVDGPDLGNAQSSYAKNDQEMPPTNIPNELESCTRILLETGLETQEGDGNGMFGHNETTEQTDQTWAIRVPTPGSVLDL